MKIALVSPYDFAHPDHRHGKPDRLPQKPANVPLFAAADKLSHNRAGHGRDADWHADQSPIKVSGRHRGAHV